MIKKITKNRFLKDSFVVLIVFSSSVLFVVARDDSRSNSKVAAEIAAFAELPADVGNISDNQLNLQPDEDPETLSKMDACENSVKELLITNFKESFRFVVDPLVLDKRFTTESISKLASGIETIDALEVLSRFNKLKFATFFSKHQHLFDVLAPNMEAFFDSCYEFISLFKHLSESYYRDRKLATYIKVIMSPAISDCPMVKDLWFSIFGICNNNSDLDDLTFLAKNYFDSLKPPRSGTDRGRIQNLVDYVFAKRAYEIQTKTLEEFKKIDSCLAAMAVDDWLPQNPYFIEKYYLNKALGDLVGKSTAVVVDKILQAKTECEQNIVDARRDITESLSNIDRLQRNLGCKKIKNKRDKRKSYKKSFCN